MILNKTPFRILAIALLLFLLFLPVAIPFRVVLLAGAALIWTFLVDGSLAPIGLGRRRIGPTLRWGLGLFIALTVIGETVQPLIEHLLGMKPDYSGYGALVGNAGAAIRLILYALVSAAVGEEILFRGFLLHQLSAISGSGTRARWIAVVTGGIIFGMGHFIQGPFGVITTGIVGAIFGWAWFRTDRNLYALIIAHALTDTYGIGMLYIGRYA